MSESVYEAGYVPYVFDSPSLLFHFVGLLVFNIPNEPVLERKISGCDVLSNVEAAAG